MILKNVVYPLLCLFIFPKIAVATTCDPGQYAFQSEESTRCETCGPNNYCDGEKATKCPEGFPNSAQGAKSAEECYKECQVTDGGTAVGSGKQYNKTGAKCEISPESCTDGYTYVKNAPTDKANEFDGYCLKTTEECKTLLKSQSCTVTAQGSNGTTGSVNGNATIDANTGTYNYTTCACVLTNRHDSNTGSHYTDSYKYNTDGTVGNTHTSTLTACDAGYCPQNNNRSCTKASLGYYHDNSNDLNCQPCPAGQTTLSTGSTSKSNCQYTSETQFCDDNGCISFPM